MNKRRYRLKFNFWLEPDKPDHEALADQIEILKESRSFVGTIRDGIRLICDLRAGRLDVLLELFPFVREAIADSLTPPPAPDDPILHQRLAAVERLLLAKDGGRVMAPVAGPKPLAVGNRPALPPPDDDDLPALVVTKSRAAGNKASVNFLASAFAVAGVQ